jgi:hypothetical protein
VDQLRPPLTFNSERYRLKSWADMVPSPLMQWSRSRLSLLILGGIAMLVLLAILPVGGRVGAVTRQTITVTPSQAAPGQSVTFSGTGWICGRQEVALTVIPPAEGAIVAHATPKLEMISGSFIAPTTPGDYKLEAVDEPEDCSATTAFQVVAPGPTYSLTLVARVCPSYADITANLLRNDFQESLQDVGADSAYVMGQPIDPSIEATHQPNCAPLNGWEFTLGSYYNASSAATDFLSTVTTPQAPITVQPSTPLLDADGNPTGQQIAAAVTVPIEGSNLDEAMQHRGLWIQGGTPTDPLLQTKFGDTNAFGAFRCAVDNLNGDNVEWIGYPTGQHHVFCFYYAVRPPPPPGVITVTKEIPAGRTDTQTFQFTGNITYNANRNFSIAVVDGAPGSVDFARAGGEAWNFTEQPTPGWVFSSLTCSSASGQSTSTINGMTASVDLAGGDHVACTYLDQPDVADLSIFKETAGGVGGPFAFSVTNPLGVTTLVGSATTTALETPVLAGTVVDATPGTYTITESLPPGDSSDWTLTSAQCNGQPETISAGNAITVTVVSPAEPIGCYFTNTLRTGGISIDKTTLGSTGTSRFLLRSRSPRVNFRFSTPPRRRRTRPRRLPRPRGCQSTPCHSAPT